MWRRRRPPSPEQVTVPASPPPVPAPDHAWKLLSITNEWIRHADTKTGVVAALTGISATLLYNLIKPQTPPLNWTCLLVVFASLTAASILATVAIAATQLAPRTGKRKRIGYGSPVFYRHISEDFAEPEDYEEALADLTCDPELLTKAVAAQVHANAGVATRKFCYATWAVRTLFASFVFLGLTAAAIAFGW